MAGIGRGSAAPVVGLLGICLTMGTLAGCGVGATEVGPAPAATPVASVTSVAFASAAPVPLSTAAAAAFQGAVNAPQKVQAPVDRRRGKALNKPFTVNGVALVSAKHRITAAYKPKVTGTDRLAPAAAKAFAAMKRAAAGKGLTLLVVSSYRTFAQQKALYAQSMRLYGKAHTRKYVAVPGTSEHQTGLAIDLRSRSGRGPTFDKTKEWRWLRANAQKYGFVLRYPKGKTSITGIGYEPWHWRYIGVAQAKAMRATGANSTLEQFLGLR